MDKVLISVIALILSMVSNVDSQVDVALIQQSSAIDDEVCYDYSIKAHNEIQEYGIASQNIRLFYNSSNAVFRAEHSGILLDSSQYQFTIAQDLTHLDASNMGLLKFDNDLGFINAAIIMTSNGVNAPRFTIDRWQSLVRLCFTKTSNANDLEIVFAREDLSATYGRAFIEISAINPQQEQVPLKILNYVDVPAQ